MQKYINYRENAIAEMCSRYAKSQSYDNYMIYVIDSHRMDFKHPKSIQLIVNPQPVSLSSSNVLTDKDYQTELELTFRVGTYTGNAEESN